MKIKRLNAQTGAAVLAIVMALGCGHAKKGKDEAPRLVPPGQKQDNQTKDEQNSGDGLALQVGVRTGNQLIAHYSTVTGIPFDSLDQNTKNQINLYLASTPSDNSIGKFKAANVVASVKIAAFFVSAMIDQEINNQNNPAFDKSKLLLPDMKLGDGNLNVVFTPASKAAFAGKMIDLFWGQGLETLPDRQAAISIAVGLTDELITALAASNPQPRNIAKAVASAIAASFPALYL